MDAPDPSAEQRAGDRPPDDSRAADEVRAAGKLAGDGLRGFIGVVRDTHTAIAKRVGEQLPPEAGPAAAAEREISSAVYGIVGAAHSAAAQAASEFAAEALPADAAAPSSTPAGASLQAAANALWGDVIEAQDSAVAVGMSARMAGVDLPLDSDSVTAAFPAATGDVVVFVHGLGEDERAWHLPFDGSSDSYGDRLAAEHGLTCLAVRYNTGLHISDNGERLRQLIDALLAAWPVPPRSVSLVGHSMGGLVCRSATHLAAEGSAEWVRSLRAVITLGSPHLGAPLEKGAHVVDAALRTVPETEALSRLLSSRSAGIKDLRYGSILSEDWAGGDPDAFLANRCAQVPLLPHIIYYWIAAVLTADAGHPVGQLLGDGLVRYPSASGQGVLGRIGFPIESGVELTSMNHLRLLNHPAVYEHLAAWLTRPPVAAPSSR